MLGPLTAAVAVFFGAGESQFAFALQEFERIAGLRHSLFLGDGQNLVLEVGTAHVVQRLAREGRVFYLVFGRHEGEHRVHERRLACGAGTLDEHGQRLSQSARRAGQVTDEPVGLFPREAAGLKIGPNPLEKFWVFQQVRRFPLFFRREAHRLVLAHGAGQTRRIALQLFELAQQARQVALHQPIVHVQFFAGAFDEQLPLTVAVQVERVDVHRVESVDF